jgi:uncharacterized protein YjbI with pentapeptide repeats
VLPGFNLYEALEIDDPKKLARKEHPDGLRGRHLEMAMLDGADLTKADLTGAQLQGASLRYAHLQGASLRYAQLQGASLDQAQLQGASLEGAWLQGASLAHAQLQGASLAYAQLQGAALIGAQLHGALLAHAQLQDALLGFASIQGASLAYAQLQGAALDDAQLQGASLSGARGNATEFSGAFLWRAIRAGIDPAELGAVRLKDARWKPVWPVVSNPNLDPVPWDAKAYAELRVSMNSIPEGKMRDEALKRIERLDCGNPDKTLASCDPAAEPPSEVLDWQKTLLEANVDDAAFQKVLATELQSLVCANDLDAVHILRGTITSKRLAATGREAHALVDFIMSKDCPVSAALTEDDKAKLLEFKQDAEKEFAPPPTLEK